MSRGFVDCCTMRALGKRTEGRMKCGCETSLLEDAAQAERGIKVQRAGTSCLQSSLHVFGCTSCAGFRGVKFQSESALVLELLDPNEANPLSRARRQAELGRAVC